MIKEILMCQIFAPLLVLDLPSLSAVNVTSIAELPRQKIYRKYNLFDETEVPKRLVITGKRNGHPFSIEVNLENNTLHRFDYNLVFGKGPSNSGELGALILGLPGVMLTFPLLLSASLVQKFIKFLTGFSWHSLVFLSKIKKELTAEQLSVLKVVLKHDSI